MKRIISLVLFAVAILCFFLPWVNYSLFGKALPSLSGFNMLTEYKYTVLLPGLPPGGTSPVYSLEPGIIISFLAMSVLGVLAAVAGWRKAYYLRIFFGISCAVLLIILLFKLNSQVPHTGFDLIMVNYLPGYWLSLTSVSLAALINFFPNWQGTALTKLPTFLKQTEN
jgi:hypothetical protein